MLWTSAVVGTCVGDMERKEVPITKRACPSILAVFVLLGAANCAPAQPAPAASPNPDRDAAQHVRIAGIVLKWLRADKEANYRRGEKMIREAAAGGAQIIVTTEGFLDGFMNGDRTIPLATYRALAERIPDGEYCRRFCELARELKVYLAIGMAEFDSGRTYNTVAFLGPDGNLIGKHRKAEMNPFEAIRDSPGDEATVLETPYGNVGFRICYERSRPHLVQQTCAAGADFVILVSGGSYGPANTRVVQARSRENGRHMVFVHPVQFLVTAPDGSVVKDVSVGGRGQHPPENFIQNDVLNTYAASRGMLIISEQVDTEADQNRVVYFDLPIRRSGG